jgi:hypothetical protein
MSEKAEFPTTSSALEQIRDGQYDIVQLSRLANEAAKSVVGSKDGGDSAGNGKRSNVNPLNSKDGECSLAWSCLTQG